MRDNLNREIDYIRISITDRCNLRCIYCMPAEGVPSLSHEEILTFDEITRIVRVLQKLGFKKVKITGGEPLVRKGCPSLIEEIHKIEGIEKVTITTNGVLLKENIEALERAGIDAINISLDTMVPEHFAKITQREQLHSVLEGINAAVSLGNVPVKINCVPIEEDPAELVKIAGLAKKEKIHVRFIEMMPIGLGASFSCRNEQEILAILEEAFGPAVPCFEKLGNGPSHYYSFEGFQGRIGFISAISHKFCHECNRIRLTADGFLKVCLQYQEGVSLKDLIRSGCSDPELQEAIMLALKKKPEGHHFNETQKERSEVRLMAQIGG